MKNLSLIFSILALLSVSAHAQKRPVKPSKKAVVKKAVKAIPRRKFDPLRDPAADLASAMETATKSGKRIILDVGGEWCGWCVYMDKFLYLNKPLTKFRDDNYVWIKINMSEENENKRFLSAFPEITGYPHLFVLDETGKLLHSQDTAVLEKGEGYDLKKFTKFLTTWSLKKSL